jgi:adenylate kinase family enzyme
MQRISIIGSTGTGKSTLAKQLASILGLECVPIDEHFWLPDWQQRSREEISAEFTQIIERDRWVIDGNYSWLRQKVWDRADTVIWLDYPLPFTFTRLLIRTVRRIVHHEVICNGNFESWGKALSTDSILLWCLNTYHKRYDEYPNWIAKPQYKNLNVYVFRSPKQTQLWLTKLEKAHAGES